MPATDLEPFPQRARRLAEAKGWSAERLSYEAWTPEIRGTSAATLKKVIAGQRALKPHLIEAVATALGVPPDEFLEYRLAMARRLFDEEQVGLAAATRNLSLLDDLTSGVGVADAGPAAEPEVRSAPQRPRGSNAAGRRSPGGS